MSHNNQQVPASDAQDYALTQLFAGLLIGGGVVSIAAALLVLEGGFGGSVVPLLASLPIHQQLGLLGVGTVGIGLSAFAANRRRAPGR